MIEIEVAGQAVQLLVERALYWPAAGLLAVADLHWGKAETFQRFGIPVPGAILEADLARLGQALDRTGARRLVVLGDLIHGATGLTAGVEARVAAWRAERRVQVVLATGNHDRRGDTAIALPSSWGIEAVEVLSEGPFSFRHEPVPDEKTHVWCGHLHPTIFLGPGTRLPCFHLRPGLGLLPAFSAFTGGPSVRRIAGDRCYALTPSRVVAVPGSAE